MPPSKSPWDSGQRPAGQWLTPDGRLYPCDTQLPRESQAGPSQALQSHFLFWLEVERTPRGLLGKWGPGPHQPPASIISRYYRTWSQVDSRKRAVDSKASLVSSSQEVGAYPKGSHGLHRSPLFPASRRLQHRLRASEGHPQVPSATMGRRDDHVLLTQGAQ